MGTFSQRLDIVGQTFGRLTVLSLSEKRGRKLYWSCRCSCGTVKAIHGDHLKAGRTSSCGCLNAELVVARLTTHGCAPLDKSKRHPLYSIWSSMKKRCFSPTCRAYPYYGGRGITVCDEWANDFARFAADIGPRPSARHSMDRINNDGDYEPGNVRWATKSEQMRNRRSWKNKPKSADAQPTTPAN